MGLGLGLGLGFGLGLGLGLGLHLEGDRARHLLLEGAARHLVEDRLRPVCVVNAAGVAGPARTSANWPRLAKAGRGWPRLEAALSLTWRWRRV